MQRSHLSFPDIGLTMKAILIIVFLFVVQGSYSQTATKKNEKKPSWGSKMPTREDAPDLKYDVDLDEDDEMERSDFGIDRSRILYSDEKVSVDESSEISPPEITSAEELAEIEKKKRKQAEKLKQEQRKAEEERLAEEQLKQQQRKAEEERLAAEQLKQQQRKAEEERIAAEQLKEQQRLEEEKRIAEQIAKEGSAIDKKEELTQENPATEESQLETVVVAPTNIQKYSWKKIKNALPEYPIKAARGKKEGWVDVELTIDSTGTVVDAKAIRFANSYRGFNNAAVRAVRKWKFEPPSNYGINDQLSKVVKIVFQL